MNKKTLIIFASIFAVVVCCCVSCFAFFFIVGGSYLNSSIKDINSQVMYPLCQDSENEEDIDGYFTPEASKQAKDSTIEMFSSMECSSFDPDNNLLAIIKEGHSVNVQTQNGTSRATYGLKQGKNYYSFNLVKSGEDWKIESVTVTY